VWLDFDDDGDPIGSCVVVPAVVNNERPPLTGNPQLAFDALHRMSPQNEPVSMDEWKDACKEFLGAQWAKRFYEARMLLLDRGYVVCNDDDTVMRRLE
jgi:hypothetical protein